MLRNDERSYGLVAILFHWVVAALFLVQLPLGYLTQSFEDQAAVQIDLYWWHRSIGLLILGLSALRIAWVLSGRNPALPVSVAASERSAAKWAHVALYLATLLVPLTGWAVVSTTAPVVATRAFGLVTVPPLPLEPSNLASAYWSSGHAFLAYAAGFVAAVHILAALRHHFTLRDDVMMRMIRAGGRGDGEARDRARLPR